MTSNNSIQANSRAIINRILRHRFNQNIISSENKFYSSLHKSSFLGVVNFRLPFNKPFNNFYNKVKSQSYIIQKRIMSEINANQTKPMCEVNTNNNMAETIFKNTSNSTADNNAHSMSGINYRTDYKPSPFVINHNTLYIDINDSYTTVKAILEIEPSEYNKGENLILDGVNLEINELFIDHMQLKENEHYKYDNEYLTVFCKYVPKKKFKFASEVIIHPETNYALTGLYKSKDIMVSQCEATGFRRITFFIDRPDIMSKYDVTLIADKKKYPILLSNGDKVDEFDVDDERHGCKFVDPYPKPCYLFAVVAGDLKHLSYKYTTKFSKKDVELYVFSEEKYVNKLKWALECLIKAMKFDEDYFGLEYDLSRLNLVAVSDFNVGAMENKSLNIFNANSLLASKKKSVDYSYERILTVVGHEYFHNYTGNRVTLRDWFQLTLKEGLTVHRENIFSEKTTKTATFRLDHINIIRSVQFLEDSSPLAHPIRPESYISMDNFYTTTVYEKGSEVMRMYHTLLGDEYYKKAINIYLKKNDGKTATCEDFNAAMEEAYKLKKNDQNANLDQFLLWYSQSGTPHVTTKYSYDKNTKEFTIHLQQVTKPTNNQKEKKPLFIPIKIGLISPTTGKELIPETLLEFTKDNETFVLKNVQEKPLPSIFRDFSSPVYIIDDITDEERILLLKYDTDPFVRYNACTDIYIKQILTNYNEMLKAKNNQNINENNTLKQMKLTPVNEHFINAIKHLLNDTNADPGFKAYIISLPTDKYILSFIDKLDTDILADTKDFVYKQMGNKLNDIYFDMFQKLKNKSDDMTYFYDESYVDFDQINVRRLRNTLLMLLSKTNYKNMLQHIMDHSNSPYPSDWLNSFIASSYYDEYFQLYEKTYEFSKDDELLLQDWLKAASRADRPDIYDIIKKLEVDVLKDSKNPNIIRSVYLPFANNLRYFNDISGKGYKLMADVIIKVDQYNPMVATQLCNSFKLWNKLDLKRQGLIYAEMDRILKQENISTNLKEYLLRLTNRL